MSLAVLGLGTNMGDRQGNLTTAIKALSLVPDTIIQSVSDIYKTAPWGYEDQDDFYNCCLSVETQLSPQALLGVCLGIESAMGRVRSVRYGPRLIDIDLLIYENFTCDTGELTLPHPRMKQRAFVLVPLMDLFPSGRAPGLYFKPYLNTLDTSGVVKLDEAEESIGAAD